MRRSSDWNPTTRRKSMERVDRQHRVAGALIGSALSDSLGTPFECGPAGAFSERFPTAARGVAT